MGQHDQHEEHVNQTIGVARKPTQTRFVAWFVSNARPVGDGGLSFPTMGFSTIDFATTIPISPSSSTTLGDSQSRAAFDTQRTNCRTFADVDGRPAFVLLLGRVQSALKRFRCQPTVVRGCTNMHAPRRATHARQPGPEQPVGWLDPGSGVRPLGDSELVPKGEVLQLERGPGTEGEAKTKGNALHKSSHVGRSHPGSWVGGTLPPLRSNPLVHLGGGEGA